MPTYKYGELPYGFFKYGYNEPLEWVNPVFDRSATDITNRTAKAYLNATDLERVGKDCNYLAFELRLTLATKSAWEITDFPTLTYLDAIIANVSTLRNACTGLPETTPAVPTSPLNSWQKWNDIEQILNDIYTVCTAG